MILFTPEVRLDWQLSAYPSGVNASDWMLLGCIALTLLDFQYFDSDQIPKSESSFS